MHRKRDLIKRSFELCQYYLQPLANRLFFFSNIISQRKGAFSGKFLLKK